MQMIRRAGDKDAERVHQLIEKLETPQLFPLEPFVEKYIRNLDNPNLIYLVAETDSTIIAFGSLQISEPLHHEQPVAEIVELIVDERSRGKSVGAQMVNAMLLLARDRGCCCMEVTSNRMRRRAHRFYAKHGFMMTHYKLTMNMGIGLE